MILLALHGTGRMSRAIAGQAENREDFELTGIVGRSKPDWPCESPFYPSLAGLPSRPQLLIDFSLPGGTANAADWCKEHSVALLSGVTGLTDGDQRSLERAAERVPVLWSPNLSFGVNLLARLCADAGRALPQDTPVQIKDIHHQWKQDAPSGTALLLGEALAQAMGQADQQVAYESIREGETIGDHTVTLQMAGETIELVHRAGDRSIFARGALDAGRWLIGQPAGFYSAQDWLSGLINR